MDNARLIAIILDTIHPTVFRQDARENVLDLRAREMGEYYKYMRVNLAPLAELVKHCPMGDYGVYKWELRRVDGLVNLHVWVMF